MTPQVALLLAVLLAGVPGGGARGGKGAKGAGGGVGRYGYRGISNSEGYEMTWEDIVLAMQLSAMCFGALLALCIVACCAYKICGPAEEEDWGSRYSVLKPAPRLPPELLREIYTLPTPTALSQASSAAANPSTATGADASGTPSHRGASGGKASGVTCAKMEGGPRVTSVSAEPVPNSTRGTATSLAHLPNGRPRGPPLGGDTTPATPRRPVSSHSSRGPVAKPPRLLNLGAMLEGRPRLLTLSAVSSARAARAAAGRGAANRLAAHNQHSSTLDLARAAATSSTPSLSHRSLSEPHTAVV
ncbi:uncharacterized protein LOC122253186 isoform X2 [Penaeus japonicus]|uniref:uncharacterized protein LOC122253186 isoform X2 n=1 Tax=Penaeus japonicus TaxID=27405 RepID=UPI001C71117B|nr:uncharacterized protein LOC122253186 isoform X2 [Penaeus japonicus]